MVDFRYGPVDLIAAAFDGDLPDPSVLAALAELVDAGQVRVLDMLLVRRDGDGALHFSELDMDDPAYAEFSRVEIHAEGLIANEDAAALVDELGPHCSATVVALELTWATALANRLASVGGVVIETQRIPAPVVNAVLDTVQPA